MFFSKVFRVATVALVVAGVTAHLDLFAEDKAQQKEHVARGGEALTKCLESPEMKDLHKRMVAERGAELHRIRKARGLDTRGDFNNLSKRGPNYHPSSD
jgi:hypothetical protein